MPSASFTTVGWHTWDVPKGVKTIKVTLDGAGSGLNGGGRVTGNLKVDDRWTLYILTGAQGGLNSGATGGKATTGGGAAGGTGQKGGVGGDSGGGASAIRINSKTGSLRAVAGGAGGDSGDAGRGGPGGGTTGGAGSEGTTGTNTTSPSTGGTQSQGGNGGTSSEGTQFNGKNAPDAVLSTAGAGGQTAATVPSHGGGGGGGGYRAGGGGQAASFGSKVLESVNQMLSPWDTAAAGGSAAKYSAYNSGTRLAATNLAPNPGLEGGSSSGWNSNNGSLYSLAVSATSPISGTQSILSTTAASVVATNLVPNPRFVGTPLNSAPTPAPAQWAPSRATVAADPAVKRNPTGPQSMKVSCNAAGGCYVLTSDTLAANRIPLSSTGAAFTMKGSIYPDPATLGAANGGSPRFNLIYYQYDAANALIGAPGGTIVACPVGQWTDFSQTFTPNAAAVTVRWGIIANTTDVSTGGVFWIAEPALVMGTYTGAYFDGATAAAPDATFRWKGTADASASERVGTGPTATSVYLQATGTSGTTAFPCVAGQLITASLDIKCEQAGRRIQAYFQWLNAAGGIISTDSTVNYKVDGALTVANQVNRIAVTGVPPALAVQCRVTVVVSVFGGGNALIGERVWLDNLRVSTGPATADVVNAQINPTLESGGLGGYATASGANYPVTVDATSQMTGIYSALSTRIGTMSTIAGAVSCYTAVGVNSHFPITPGTPVTASIDVKCERTNRRVRTFFQWFDAASGNMSTPIQNQWTTVGPGETHRAVMTATPPAGAWIGGRFRVQVDTTDGNSVLNERVWFDNMCWGSADRIDGSMAPDGTYVYTWTGTGTASTSQRWAVQGTEQNGYAYFDGDTAATTQLSYAWTGTAKASTSTRSYNGNNTIQVISGGNTGIPASDRRPVVQATNTGGNLRIGLRTHATTNIPAALTAGTTITFSAWVRLSPGYPLGPLGVQCFMRDDPNADSAAVTFDVRGAYRAINPGVWTRLDWTATVNSGRTITGIYLDPSVAAGTVVLPVGEYLQTTAWMVNKSPALIDYYDGDTADDSFYDYAWGATRGASVSNKLHQTTPYSPGGGGAGGSSYTGGLTGPTNVQGGAGTGNGSITITWSTPAPANQPPTPPTGVKINNVDATGEMLTKATTSVKVTATINDPNADNVRMLARWSASPNFTSPRQVTSKLVKRNTAVTLTLGGLAQNRHYYVRLYTQDSHGLWSTSYTSVDFWTNRAPWATPDSINTQGSGMTLPSISSAKFAWTHNDYDVADYQSGFRVRYRVAATSTAPAGAWTSVKSYTGDNTSKVDGPPTSAVNSWTFNPNTFKGNRFYEWSVVTRDGQALWGAESTMFTFWVSSVTTPPQLLTPRDGGALDVGKANTFTWKFLDPDPTKKQVNADLRYRAVGATKAIADGESPIAGQWISVLGLAGTKTSLTLPDGSLLPEFTYEWEVRTYNSAGGPASDWSDPFFFYAIGTPGADAGPFDVADNAKPQGSLGCGTYRVFIYQQGGQKRIGEVDPVTTLSFSRLRDDISNCVVLTNGYSEDCGQLYAQVRSWMHEIVVYRDGVRVWEGPITRITYTQTSVEFEAKDVMAYVYRRVMRYGYNDAYRLVKKGTGGQPDDYLGLLSVVKRAQELIVQGLAPYDPNVLRYLTAIEFDDDARESRVVANWSRTIWEEVDDLAATAGLDYTTVGRRILLWDTHRAIGRLPELRDGDFSDSPIVTEYGMQLATFFAVTNNSGVAGTAEVAAKTKPYGPIELVASSYSETEGASEQVQTPEALAKAQAALVEQAKRNISGRWPSPLIVRIPDNSTLSPNANIGFQQLIPGVWMPLRSINTPRQVLQWQKLDSVSVDVDNKGETVKVVLSPAPNGGMDPDADSAAEPD